MTDNKIMDVPLPVDNPEYLIPKNIPDKPYRKFGKLERWRLQKEINKETKKARLMDQARTTYKDSSPTDPAVAKFYPPIDQPETLKVRSGIQQFKKRKLTGLGTESEWQKLSQELISHLKQLTLLVSKTGTAWLLADALARMASADESVSLETMAAPIIEPPKILAPVDSQTATILAETAMIKDKQEPKAPMAAMGKADLGEAAEPVIKISGSPTVYNAGIWETVINNRLKGSKNLPPLNPELNGNKEAMELIKDHRIIAVNPASFDSEYDQLVRTIIKSAEKQKLSRETLIKTLNTNPKLRELANKLIGQIIYLKLPNGSFQKMVIMDTLGAGDSLSTPSSFTADFDQRFLEDVYRIVWDGKQYIDKDTGKPVKNLPAVSLYG